MAIGSHDGDDHFVVTDDEEVERILVRDIPESQRDAFRVELTAAAPYATRPALRARIHLAMLFVADGDIAKLGESRELADTDWRDLLMQAEYPSTPPFGTSETRETKAARQRDDIDAMTAFRNRPGPPASPE